MDNNSEGTGITIEDALSILSQRKPHLHADCNSHAECNSQSISDSAKHMGQTIDLLEKSSVVDEEQEKEKMRIKGEERRRKLQKELNGMSESDLLRTVLSVQEDRAKVYNDYERYVPLLDFSSVPACETRI